MKGIDSNCQFLQIISIFGNGKIIFTIKHPKITKLFLCQYASVGITKTIPMLLFSQINSEIDQKSFQFISAIYFKKIILQHCHLPDR